MKPEASIFVAGHRGLVGSALVRRLRAAGFENLLLRERGELDLTDQRAVAGFFARERPQYVLLAAARVGGILANNTYPAEFLQQNLAIQANVIDSAGFLELVAFLAERLGIEIDFLEVDPARMTSLDGLSATLQKLIAAQQDS